MWLSEITYSKVLAQTKDQLKSLYNKAGKIFSPTSPYWQIISVVEAIFQLNMLYIKKALKQYDITDPANNNLKAIRSRAVLSGYIPNRASTASGTLAVKIKPNSNIANDIYGNTIVIYDRTQLKNDANGYTYSINLGQEKVSFPVEPGKSFYLNIQQGIWREKTFTGTGEDNQSFVISGDGTQEVDNRNFKVYVNSELWTPKKTIKDLLPFSNEYVARTSISGALDIIFGNGHLGAKPAITSIIKVLYLVTEGSEGNVVNAVTNDFKFIEPIYDKAGNELDGSQLFDVSVSTPVQFGTDGESATFIKNMLPFSSAHDIMLRPEHFEFHLKRLNIFSTVKAYTSSKTNADYSKRIIDLNKKNTALASSINNINSGNVTQALLKNVSEVEKTQKLIAAQLDNTIYLYLVPDVVKNYIGKKGVTYFTIPAEAFLLDEQEKERIIEYLTASGDIATTVSLKVIDPKIARYVLNINLRLFKSAILENVEAEVRQRISDYFLNQTRKDRIPPSDIIRIVEEVNGVDSADASFISEFNERYHAEYAARYEQFQIESGKMPGENDIIMSDGNTYNPNKIIGLDPLFGDIVLEEDELPLIRGGWQDRNGVKFAETPGNGNLSPLNIMVYPERSKR
jgi:hypothetical protein